jgi:thiol-disulfide isomerase/thioredoxin
MRAFAALLTLGALFALAWLVLRPTPQSVAPAPATGARAQATAKATSPAPASDAGPTLAEQAARLDAAPAGTRGDSDTSSGAADAPRAPLCDAMYAPGEGALVELEGARDLRAGGAKSADAWRWVNLWAAWCKPCIEEMPALVDWAAKQRAPEVRLTLVSVDDDERQLRKFLSGAGAGIAAEMIWLPEDAARARLAEAAKVKHPPTLPLHVLLDPTGRVRCVREGEVSAEDLAAASAWLASLGGGGQAGGKAP